MDEDWFDELSENNGIDPKNLSKGYEKEYGKNRPILLKDVLPDDIVSNIDTYDMEDFGNMDFYPNSKPYMVHKKFEIYNVDEDIFLIKNNGKFISMFYVYQNSTVHIRKNELHMNGWDYNIIYSFSDNSWDEINVR